MKLKIKIFILLLLVLNSSLFSDDLYYIDIEKTDTDYYSIYKNSIPECKYNDDIGKFIYLSFEDEPFHTTMSASTLKNSCPLSHNGNTRGYIDSTLERLITEYFTTGICEKYTTTSGTKYGLKRSHNDTLTIYKCPYIKPICEAPEVWNDETNECKLPCEPIPNHQEIAYEEEECNIDHILSIFPEDGSPNYVKNIFWSECHGSCWIKVLGCPTGQIAFENVCKTPENYISCPSGIDCFIRSFGVSGSQSCFKTCECNGLEVFNDEVSCDELPVAPPPDTNSTTPPDGDDGGDGGDGSGGDGSGGDGSGGDGGGDVGDVGDGGDGVGDDGDGVGDGGDGVGDGVGDGGDGVGDGGDGVVDGGDDDGDGDEGDSSLDFLSDEMGNILNKYSFNFSNGSCGSLSPIIFNFRGRSITILSQAHINLLPVENMKMIIIFLFTFAALSIVFRTS